MVFLTKEYATAGPCKDDLELSMMADVSILLPSVTSFKTLHDRTLCFLVSG